jgi:uncharacterized cysteine cluster protein YcgN (CxxCxxCC family)/dihydrodipicolinate synthase/N-acetylneuraminate lyase
MTEHAEPSAVPFWQRKRLGEMTQSEWESICDGCGRCCLEKLVADDTHVVYPLDIGCSLLDTATGGCTDYANRLSRDVGCFKLTSDRVVNMPYLPSTCGYQRIQLGKPLEWWHPLVSGDPDTVRQAGISAAGRFIARQQAGPWENHTVSWPLRDVTNEPSSQWLTAMFGGVNASVPTPYGEDTRVDLDLMAAHCFWLLANGCHGLTILDKTGEVASLAVDERIAIIEGLVVRGVPASKLLTGIGPASPADGARIAARVADLGIRGVMLTTPTAIRSQAERGMPLEIISAPVLQLMQSVSVSLHLYLSLPAGGFPVAASLTALESLIEHSPGQLKGIRDEALGCKLGLAAQERFRESRFEVYTADDAALGVLIQHGGAGLISPGANLLSRLCAAFAQSATPDQSAQVQKAIASASEILRSRPTVPVIKALLARHTGNPAWNTVRLPLRPLKQSERDVLFHAFDATGIQL